MQSKVIKNIPDILALNCGMENIRDLEFWKIQQMVRFFFNFKMQACMQTFSRFFKGPTIMMSLLLLID
jgi:hypothetical protein